MRDIRRITIENGLNAHLLQTRKFKTNVVTAIIRSELTKENAARNSMLAGILGLGCADYKTAAEIARQIEDMYGASLEINVVKKGEEHIIQLYLEVVKDESVFARAGELLNSILFEPLVEKDGFREDYFTLQMERQKQVIAGEINDKRKYALKRCIEIMCENERFGVSGDGSVEELNKISPQSLYGHYRKIFAECAIEACVIGDMNEDYCVNWVKQTFGRKNVRLAEYKPAMQEYSAHALREKREETEAAQGKLVIGARCGAAPVGRDFHALLLLSEILGGSSGSKFFKNIREKHSLCYYAHSFIYRAKSIMIIQAGIDEKNYGKTLELLMKETEKAGEGQITQGELKEAKGALINQFETMKDSPQALIDYYMTNALLGDKTEISEMREQIETVALEDVCACANKIIFDTAFFLT